MIFQAGHHSISTKDSECRWVSMKRGISGVHRGLPSRLVSSDFGTYLKLSILESFLYDLGIRTQTATESTEFLVMINFKSECQAVTTLNTILLLVCVPVDNVIFLRKKTGKKLSNPDKQPIDSRMKVLIYLCMGLGLIKSLGDHRMTVTHNNNYVFIASALDNFKRIYI